MLQAVSIKWIDGYHYSALRQFLQISAIHLQISANKLQISAIIYRYLQLNRDIFNLFADICN